MTNPKFTRIHCSNCGAVLGKRPGEQPVFGVICEDPMCSYQPVPYLDEMRDSYITTLAQDHVKVVTVAKAFGLTRQRVYQIFDKWKSGI